MRTKYWLLLIFLFTLILRLAISFYLPNFTYESYFHLRQVEQITATGLPDYQDGLSYGGRNLIFPPAFHYLAAGFDLFLPLELVAKILPNLLLASLTIIIFLISKRITNYEPAALLSAFIAGFLPILFQTNSFTPESLFLPLLFLTIYAFIRIKENKHLYLYLFLFILLSLTSPATILILVGFIIYLILSLIEKIKINREEIELMIFSLFLYVWIQFLFYKDTLLKEGINFIQQNIPPPIILQYFPRISIIQAIVLVSVVPFLAGIYMVYRSLFQLKGQKAFLLISFALSTALLLWLRLIQFRLSLAFFGLTLGVLFATFYQEMVSYLQKIKAGRLKNIVLTLFVLILVSSMVYPAIATGLKQEMPSKEEINAFNWLNQNTPPKSVVLASLEEGNLVTYYSQRKNLMDDQFNLIKDVEKRFNDLNLMFTTKFQTQALSLADQYRIQYLVLTEKTKQHYQLDNFAYLTPECFELIYDYGTKIYLVQCKLSYTSI